MAYLLLICDEKGLSKSLLYFTHVYVGTFELGQHPKYITVCLTSELQYICVILDCFTTYKCKAKFYVLSFVLEILLGGKANASIFITKAK